MFFTYTFLSFAVSDDATFTLNGMAAFRKRQRALEKYQRLHAQVGGAKKNNVEKKTVRETAPVPPPKDVDREKRKRSSSVDSDTQPIKRFLPASPSTKPSGSTSRSCDDKWWRLLVNFEDLTLESASLPWDTRLNSQIRF